MRRDEFNYELLQISQCTPSTTIIKNNTEINQGRDRNEATILAQEVYVPVLAS
jgi:hypothetical protein